MSYEYAIGWVEAKTRKVDPDWLPRARFYREGDPVPPVATHTATLVRRPVGKWEVAP